jgi:hypothetical protein
MTTYVARSLGEAAQLLHISRGALYQRIKQYGIGQLVDGRWCFTQADLDYPVPPVGRPRRRHQPTGAGRPVGRPVTTGAPLSEAQKAADRAYYAENRERIQHKQKQYRVKHDRRGA